MPERGVGLTIAAAVKPVSFVLAAAGVERRGTAEVSEGRLVAKAFRIVTGGDEKRRRGVRPDAQSGDKFGAVSLTKGLRMPSSSAISSSRVMARRASIRREYLVSEMMSRLAPGR